MPFDLKAMRLQELGGNATMLFYQSEEGNEARAQSPVALV